MHDKTINSSTNSLVVKRTEKQSKSNVITIRLTEEEIKKLKQLKKEMKFKTMSDLFLFFMDITNKLFEWQKTNYKFFINDQKNGNSLQEVKFEFVPGN